MLKPAQRFLSARLWWRPFAGATSLERAGVLAAGLGNSGAPAGFGRLVLEAYQKHPTLYALASVIALLVAGALLGLATEAALAFLGCETEAAERVE